MSSSAPKYVAIVGAGLSGLSLAIALHRVSIPCIVYESRSKSFNLGGGIMLSPNALGVLDSLGVYERIRHQGFNFDICDFKNATGETTDSYYFGSQQLYGYQALRIYRQVLLDELLLMLEECGITVNYEMKFTHVISESSDEVVCGFADGSTASASFLIGADGIHSRVRRYIYPDLSPVFSGFVAMTSAVPRSVLRIPENYHMPVTIMAKPGAFVMAPQDVDGSEIMVGTQRTFQERTRAGWDDMLAGQEKLLDTLRHDLHAWPDVVQSALENISIGRINIWPFYGVPKLDKWASAECRVIILGDAAHPIPPTAGQGVNQAFEDIYMLALLLSKLSSRISLPEALSFWQDYRQRRIDRVLDLTRQMNSKRLPAAEQAKLAASSIWKSEDTDQLRWLYEPALDKQVCTWIQERERQVSDGV